MPQAAFADSTTARGDQPQIPDLDRFHDTINQIEALTMMLDATLSQGSGFHRDISSGIAGLFRGQASDLRDMYDAIKTDHRAVEHGSKFQAALTRLSGVSSTDIARHKVTDQKGDEITRITIVVLPAVRAALEAATGNKNGNGSSALLESILIEWLLREERLTVPEAPAEEAGQ